MRKVFSNSPSRCAVKHKNAKIVKIGQEVETEQLSKIGFETFQKNNQINIKFQKIIYSMCFLFHDV